ncbi:MAG: hypothetical protein ACK5DR_00980, partial [Planctomyces sp.]
MNMLARLVELCGLKSSGRRRRSRIWSSVAASAQAIQQLETRCLMSASSAGDRSGDSWSFRPESADGITEMGGVSDPSVDGGVGGGAGPISCFADAPGTGDFGVGDGTGTGDTGGGGGGG